MVTKSRSSLPIFKDYSINEIAETMGREVIYVAQVMSGSQKLSPKFMKRAAKMFGKTEAELFGAPEPQPATGTES